MKTTEQLQEAYEKHKEELAPTVVESTGLKKLKIAICVSGQTRHFNDDPLYTEDFNKILSLFDEYDYDLFGHTWADHKDPHDEVLSRFKEYRSDPQSIIWDEITGPGSIGNGQDSMHWKYFLPFTDKWMEHTDYRDMLNGTSDTSFIDFAKDRIYGAIGQVWSAHESFLLTKNHFATNNYEFVVKIRWDDMINLYHGHDFIKEQIDKFKQVVYNWSNRHPHFSNNPGNESQLYPSCLCADDLILNSFGGIPYANDHIYLIRGITLKENILTFTPYELFKNMLVEPAGRMLHNIPTAHTLWMVWLLNAGLTIGPLLPNFIQSNGSSDSKTNNYWGQ